MINRILFKALGGGLLISEGTYIGCFVFCFFLVTGACNLGALLEEWEGRGL